MSQELWDDLWGDSSKEEIVPKSSFNSVKLAKYFDDQLISAPWYKGFGLVNLRGLAGQLAKWKTRVDSDTVKAMIDKYLSDPSFRGKNPGWQDFLYNAERLAVSLTTKEESATTKTYWELETEKWEREHGNS